MNYDGDKNKSDLMQGTAWIKSDLHSHKKANEGNECPLCSGDPDKLPAFLVKMGKLEGKIRQLDRKVRDYVWHWPETSVDSDKGREWIHPVPPRYYLHEAQGAGWVVIDRQTDIAVTNSHPRKHDTVREFFSKAKRGGIE